MQPTHAAPPRLELDAKRIAATSGVIALHVGVLMMLMMPPRIVESFMPETVVVPNWEEPKPIPPTPPPPKDPQPRQPQHEQMVQTTPVRVPDPPPVSVDTKANAMSEQYVEAPPLPPTDFGNESTGSIFQQLAVVSAPPPPYPRMAETRRVQGTVTLRIHVSATGEPLKVSVENSSGSTLLDQAALKFVKARWRFVPAQQDGRATDAWALVPIEFVLR